MMMRVILAALLAACAPQGLLELEPPPTAAYDERSACSDAPPQSPICIVNAPDIDETAARAALNDEEFAIQRDGDQLTLFARVAAENADLCCSLQGPMTRIGETDLFVVRYRLSRLDDAALTFFPPSWLVSGRSFRREDAYRWFGPNAAQPPPVVEELRGERFERTLWSEHLQETRRIFFYLPPGYERSRAYPAVFMADGASVMVLAPMFERLISDGKMAPVVFVGAGSGQSSIIEDRSDLGITDFRSADYLPDFEQRLPRYEQHMRFFTEELVTYARREFGISSEPAQRVVTGFSNGGSFSLYAALQRPDVFGVSIPLSPAWRSLTEAEFSSGGRARFLMAAGLYEVGRHRRASQHAEVLRARGYAVTMETPAMGHDRDQEVAMLARFLPLVFPASAETSR
jgi:enterochelin esterase-like enzyme